MSQRNGNALRVEGWYLHFMALLACMHGVDFLLWFSFAH